jgi:phage-related minor tail protein
VQTVVKDFERLQDVSPVLALVVQALVEHIHYLVEVAGAAQARVSTFNPALSSSTTHLLNVKAAISAMSVPVGPQGSLEVATNHMSALLSQVAINCSSLTISHLDLHTTITLCDILDAPDDFGHLDNGRSLQRRPAVDVRRGWLAARWMVGI